MIFVVGIGEDGLDGLGPKARAQIEGADVLAGGERHLNLIAGFTGPRVDWCQGIDAIAVHVAAGKKVVVLASGDPLYFGVAKNLIQRFGADLVTVLPTSGAVSLACAAMGWSQPDVRVVTLHGRPLESLNLYLAPGVRVVALTHDGDTPAQVVALLKSQGFGPSRMTVLEHLGGAKARRIDDTAEAWDQPACAALNTLALDLKADATARPFSRVAGLPDDAFLHDGQLTKRHVRAVTLSSLSPLPGQTLWDLGAGAGSISIEWMRADASCAATAVERDPVRADRIRANAARLGVPRLSVHVSDSLDALNALDGTPDAVFVGGGVSAPGLLPAAWARLVPGGRLVANAVTDKSRDALTIFQTQHGGTLTVITVEGKAPITQYLGIKPVETIHER